MSNIAETPAAPPVASKRALAADWYKSFSDPIAHPRLAFIIEYIEGLLVTVGVYVLTRLAYAMLLWIDRSLPASGPGDTEWYLPIKFSRALVTVVDSVALLLILISSVVGLFRLSNDLWQKKVIDRDANR